MTSLQIHRVTGKIVIVLSGLALLTVLIGYTQPHLPDEGALAHVFQLSIAALVPAILFFLGTADWKRPGQEVRSLAFPAATLVLAFGALYYLEHYRCGLCGSDKIVPRTETYFSPVTTYACDSTRV